MFCISGYPLPDIWIFVFCKELLLISAVVITTNEQLYFKYYVKQRQPESKPELQFW